MTYGLSYGWQTTPQERDGKQALMVDAGNGNKVLTAKDYLDAKAAAAAAGNFYDPTIGYMPIRTSGRSNVFNVDYGDFAPRFSIAWNPSYGSGFLRSEEHTSELQSRGHLVCRLLLEKKNT